MENILFVRALVNVVAGSLITVGIFVVAGLIGMYVVTLLKKLREKYNI